MSFTRSSRSRVFLHYRDKGTRVPFHAEIRLRFNLKQQQNFAEPNIVHSQIECPVRNPGRTNEDKVLTIGFLQFLQRKRPGRNALLMWVLCMPYCKSVEDYNMPFAFRGAQFLQSVHKSPIL